jgi:acyl-CoA thioesterase I
MSVISRVDIWGDSILKGVVLDEAAGRYKLLKESAVEAFSRRFSLKIKNHSRFGCTAPRALEKMAQELETGLHTDVVLLEFGGNDCDFNWREVSDNPDADHEPNTPITVFTETMREMVRALTARGITPLLMSLPPIDSYRYFDWITKPKEICAERILSFLGDKEYIYRHQELYSLAITRVALEEGVGYVDVRDAFLRERRLDELLCADGIHPNEKGQKILRDTFSGYYNKSPRIASLPAHA